MAAKISQSIAIPSGAVAAVGERAELGNHDRLAERRQLWITVSENFLERPPLRPASDWPVVESTGRHPVHVIAAWVVFLPVLIGNVRRPNPHYGVRLVLAKPLHNVAPRRDVFLFRVVLRSPRITVWIVHLVPEAEQNGPAKFCRCARPFIDVKIVIAVRNGSHSVTLTCVTQRNCRMQ